MLGFIIKICFLVIVVMVGLNIFAPEQADKVVSLFSEKTQIEESTLKDSLDTVTNFTKDTVNEVSQTVQKSLDK